MNKVDVLAKLRSQDRITFNQLQVDLFDELIELHGDRTFGDDPALFGGIGKIGDQIVTVLGNQKGNDTKSNIKYNFAMVHPEGYRKASRLVKQAQKFNRPIIAFIDTPGAYPGISSEERGQGSAIAHMLEILSDVSVPVICVIISEGGSGGALAIGVGDYIIGFENCYYSVISPEGYAEILYKGQKQVADVIDEMAIFSSDLLKLGVIDEVYDEQDPAKLKQMILDALMTTSKLTKSELIQKRYDRYNKF